MSCCNKTYETKINNTPVVFTESTPGCYISRFKTDKTAVKKRRVKSTKPCCDNIDLTKFKRNFEWVDGICTDGVLTYDTIRYSSKEELELIVVEDNITAQELVNQLSDYNLSLQKAVELISTRVTNSSEDCKEVFCNEEITRVVSVLCPPGTTGGSATITVPECQFTSIISVQDANNQAQLYIEEIKDDFIANNLTCTALDRFCNEEVSGSFLKPNCPINTIPQEVPLTIPANTLCNYVTQETANLAAQNLLDSQLESNAIDSDPTVYCLQNLIEFPSVVVAWYVFYEPDPDQPGGIRIREQGTSIVLPTISDTQYFSVGNILQLKYINRDGAVVIKSKAISSISANQLFLQDLLLDDILAIQQASTLAALLIKNLIDNSIYLAGLNSSSLLPF